MTTFHKAAKKTDYKLLQEVTEWEIAKTIYQFPDTLESFIKAIPLEHYSEKYKRIFEVFYTRIPKAEFCISVLYEAGIEKDIIMNLGDTYLFQSCFPLIECFHKYYIKNQAINICNDTLTSIHYESRIDPIGEIERRVKVLQTEYNRDQQSKSFGETMREMVENLQNVEKIDNQSILTKKYPRFDKCFGGIRPGKLIVIMGAEKNGKTTFAQNLILDYSKQNIPCGIISLEMTAQDLHQKFLSMVSEIPFSKIVTGRYNKNEKEAIENALKTFDSLPLYISDKKPMNEDQINVQIKEWIKQHSIKIVLIDPFLLIKSSLKAGKAESVFIEHEQVSRRLKELTLEHNISIILLHHTNRDGAKSPSPDKTAGTISINRDCDYLFTIQRPEAQGSNSITIGSKKMNFDQNQSLVRLQLSRFTQKRSYFKLEMTEYETMNEVDINYTINN